MAQFDFSSAKDSAADKTWTDARLRQEDDYELPQELREREQWLCFAIEDGDKVPYAPRSQNGRLYNIGVRSEDEWADYDTALQFVQQYDKLTGVGFVFTESDNYVGIDLDDVVNDENKVTEMAKDVITRLDSFTEFSPSGDGLHVLAKGTLDCDYQQKCNEQGIEMYDEGRFFTVTGNHVAGFPETINERGETLRDVQRDYFNESVLSTSNNTQDDVEPIDGSVKAQEIVDTACDFSDKFERLYNGNDAANGGSEGANPSAADMSFCCLLAFWTKKDKKLMDEIFRMSDRMRGKWDEQRGSQTYGELTIEKAVQVTDDTYGGSY